MAYEFRLPDIGEGLTEAEITRWLVKEGDSVAEDEPFVEIQTDKALVEMPAPATGTVVRLGAAEGDVLPVGDVLIVIDDAKLAAPSRNGQPGPEAARALATPATRRLAREMSVDLRGLAGTGPGGRVSDEDVRAAAAAPSSAGGYGAVSPAVSAAASDLASDLAAQPEDERIPLRGLRRRITETMTQSWQAVPHITAFREVDAGELLALRQRLTRRAEAAGVPLTLTAFLVKAAALALVEHPMVNSSIDVAAAEIVVRASRNIGVAVSTPAGLIVPVVRDADRRSLLAVSAEVREHSIAARDRRIPPAALTGGTFTVTNHGPLGGWFGTAIIRPPEAAILGFGRVQDRPAVVDGRLEVRPVLPMSFAADHRIIDGDLMLAFCITVQELLENPAELLLSEG